MRRLIPILGLLSLLVLAQGCASTATVNPSSEQERAEGSGLLTGQDGYWKVSL